jgi:flagellar hook protein FlgE
MDVIGNNIANVNTTGYKSGRVTFEESMAQLLKGAMRPPGNSGGTNPMQLGLGMSVGSVDNLQTQGNLQSTGQITDLALEGKGYFVYSSGDANYFSRNGALQMDANGKLVCPTNGYILQGKMADADGTYPPGTQIGDIRIPFGDKAPANATTEVAFSSNLDKDSEGLGTVVHTSRFLADAEGGDSIAALFNQYGESLNVRSGETITVSAEIGGTTYTDTLSVDDTTSLTDLVSAIDSVVSNTPSTVSLLADGSIQIDNGAGNAINNLQVRSSNPLSDPYLSNVCNWGPSIPTADDPATAGDDTIVTSGTLRAPAEATDLLANVYDASGNPVGTGFEDGDTIRINGDVGGNTIDTSTLTYAAASTTLQSVLDQVRTAFSLPVRDGTPQNNLSVAVNPGNTPDDQIPDGAIVVRGQPQTAFSLNNVSITAENSDNDQTSPTRFTSNVTMTQIQQARDTTQHATSITVYDESGDAHVMTTTFTHSGEPNEWNWEITMDGGEQILQGNTGTITFGQDGSPSSFTFDDNATAFTFDPMNGSNEVAIRLDVGSPGSFQGITQFRAPTTTAAESQDGYPMGKLEEISIDEYGGITGNYTNGVNKSIAQIYIADFNNPAGLMKKGDSMFSVSNNSGDAVLRRPGIGSSTQIKPGALEMSNVELSTEFTRMISTQRGYQANARVITTSDTMLQELVQLVR